MMNKTTIKIIAIAICVALVATTVGFAILGSV